MKEEVRTISSDSLQLVTKQPKPDTLCNSRCGWRHKIKTDSRPLERKPTIVLKDLGAVTMGVADEDLFCHWQIG
jgi:type I restriction enzyme R subunit